jgi:hypothetical protein
MSLTKVTYSMIDGITVNVSDFGAVGDGVADDRAAIENAINSLASTGGTVYFPKGTYLLNSYSSDTARASAHAQILPILSNVSLVGQSGSEIVVGNFFDDKNFSVFNGLAAVKTNSVELKNIGFYNLNVSFNGATSIMRTAYRLRVIMRLGWVINGIVDGCYFNNGDLSNGIASGVEFAINDVRGNELKITNNTFKNLVQQNAQNIDFSCIYNGASRTVIANNIFEETTDQAAIIGCAVEMHNSFISTDNNIITGYTRGVWFVASDVEVFNPIGQSATNNTAYITNAFAYIWVDTGCSLANINCSNNSIFCAHIVGYSQLYNGNQGLVSSSNPLGTGDVVSALFSGNMVNIVFTLPAYLESATAAWFERPFSNIQIKGNYFKNVKGGVQFLDDAKSIFNFSMENNTFECESPEDSYINLTCDDLAYCSIFGNVFRFSGTPNTTNTVFNVTGGASNCLLQENNFAGLTPTYTDVDFTSGAFPGFNNKYEYYWYGPDLVIPSLAAGVFGIATMSGTPPTQFATNGSQFQWIGDGDPAEISIATTTTANSSTNIAFLCANKSISSYAGGTVPGTLKASLFID